MKNSITILSLCVALFSIAQDCNNTLLISIKDAQDEVGISDANMFWYEKQYMSDSMGNIKINSICAGTHFVEISKINYHDYHSTLNIVKDTVVVVFLKKLIDSEPHSILKVKANKKPETLVNISSVSPEPDRAGATLAGELSAISGLSVLYTGQNIAKPIIHGMHSSRVPVFQNGIRLEDQEWGVEHDPNVDITAFQEIRVVKGATALRYAGDGIGGLVVMEPQKMSFSNTVNGKLSTLFSTNGRGGSINTTVQKGFSRKVSFQMHASGTLLGDLNAPDYILSNTGTRNYSAIAQSKIKLGKSYVDAYYSYIYRDLGILQAAHTGSLVDLVNAINATQPSVINPFTYSINEPRQQIQHHLGKLLWFNPISTYTDLSVAYGFQFNKREEFDLRRTNKNKATVDLQLTTHDLLIDLDFHKWRNFHIITGLNFQYQNNFANPETGVSRLIPDYNKYSAAAYASFIANIGKAWKLESGARFDWQRVDAKKFYTLSRWEELGYDHVFPEIVIGEFGNQILVNPILDFGNFSALAAVKWEKKKERSLLLNLGIAMRSPNPSELFSDGLHHSAASIELGNLELKSETAYKVNMVYHQDIPAFKAAHVSISPYYNYIRNYINQIPTGAEFTIRGSFPVWSYERIDAEIYGIDLDFGFEPASYLTYRASLAYLVGNDKTREQALINMPPFSWKQSLKYNFLQKKNAYVEIGTEYFARQTRYPNFNFELSYIENNETIEKELDLSTPPPSYLLLNAELGYKFAYKKKDMLLSIIAHNILDKSYRNYLNRLRYFSDDIGRNVTLSLTLNF